MNKEGMDGNKNKLSVSCLKKQKSNQKEDNRISQMIENGNKRKKLSVINAIKHSSTFGKTNKDKQSHIPPRVYQEREIEYPNYSQVSYGNKFVTRKLDLI